MGLREGAGATAQACEASNFQQVEGGVAPIQYIKEHWIHLLSFVFLSVSPGLIDAHLPQGLHRGFV